MKSYDSDIQNSSLTADDKTTLYRANAIARYSSSYWVAESQNTNTEWTGINGSKGPEGDYRQGDPPEWVYADLKAALGTALFAPNPITPLIGGAVASGIQAFVDSDIII